MAQKKAKTNNPGANKESSESRFNSGFFEEIEEPEELNPETVYPPVDDDSLLKLSVVKSNEFIRRSQFDLNLFESRIINFIIANVDKKATHFNYMVFPINQFCKACGIVNTNPSYIKNVIKTLSDKSVTVVQKEYETTKDGAKILKESIVPIRWLDDYEIDLTNKKIKVRLHKRLKPFLLDMKKNFTKAELYYYLSFKCKYTSAVYDLLRSYANISVKSGKPYSLKISVEDFRARLNIKDRLDRFCDLTRRVIDPVVEEINDETDLAVSWERIKEGREIVGLEFIISPKDQDDIIRIYEKARLRMSDGAEDDFDDEEPLTGTASLPYIVDIDTGKIVTIELDDGQQSFDI